MIDFYYSMAPNPMKVALFLEEAGLEYRPHAIEAKKGEQFTPAYVAINPNSKLPAIVDGGVTVFDSNAILLYLAEKTKRFLPPDEPAARGEMLSWLMFVASGIGPFSGQSVHFRHYAPEPNPYASNRYTREAERHWGILDRRLAERRYVLGETYTIVDMAVWGWGRILDKVLGEDAAAEYRNLSRLLAEISSRPAAVRAAGLGALHQFKQEFDEEARRFMFPQNVPKAEAVTK